MPAYNSTLSSDLLPAVLAVSLTAVHIVRPVYGESGIDLLDFALEYLNPAGQRLVGLPEQPGGTVLTRFPHTVATGIFAYYRRAFETGDLEAYEVNYEADGLTSYFRFQAQRSGEVLVVSFTDAPDAHAIATQALRLSQARELAARAEAEAQHQHLHQVLMRMPANIALFTGPDHVYTLINTEYNQLFPGRTLLGRTIRQAIPEIEGQGFYELLDQVYQTGEPFYQAEAETWADFSGTGRAEQRYYHTSFEPIHDAQGKVVEVLNFAVDVTTQVLARQRAQTLNEELAALNEELRTTNDEYQVTNVALSKAQQQLRHLNHKLEARVAERTREAERQRRQWEQLFMRAPAAICIFDGPEWVYEFVNPGYQAMFPGRELLGKPLLEALPEVAGQPLVPILRHVYDTGEPFEGTEILVPLARVEGGPIEAIYFDLTYMARYNDAGQIDGFITYAYDVTQQVLARREREARQADLQRIFERAPVAIGILRGPTFIIELANSAMRSIWGRTPEQLLGRPNFEALPDTAGQGFEAILNGVFTTGEAFHALEAPATIDRAQTGVPTLGYFNFVFQPLYSEREQISGVIAVGIEVTEQVLARQKVQSLNEELRASNEELQRANTQLTRSNVDLDTFVYTASHDLKAPITNIEGLLLALQTHLPADVQQQELVSQLLGMMQTTIDRFRLTIHQLTDVSRLQHAQNQPAEPVNLAKVVEAVRLDLLPLLHATQAQLTVELAPDLVVLFAPKNLRSVVYNLLSNALKYHQPDQPPVITLGATRSAEHVVLTVQDQGLGLTESQQRRLFGLFQRLHTHVEGTGVGLYMVKRMVENAGGTIMVQSQPGQGTTFSITLLA
jgi:signal transduction histidine kinase